MHICIYVYMSYVQNPSRHLLDISVSCPNICIDMGMYICMDVWCLDSHPNTYWTSCFNTHQMCRNLLRHLLEIWHVYNVYMYVCMHIYVLCICACMHVYICTYVFECMCDVQRPVQKLFRCPVTCPDQGMYVCMYVCTHSMYIQCCHPEETIQSDSK